MSRFQKIFSIVPVVAITAILFACGSTIDGSGTTDRNQSGSSNAGFDPTISSNLEVVSYQVIQSRLTANFKLATTSAAYQMLVANQSVFDVPDPYYSSLFQTTYTKIMGLACQGMETETFFPDNKPVIDTVWRSLTGKLPSTGGAKDIETSILSDTAGQTVDVKMFSLCMAAALDVHATFINYRD